jgi:hypothetical protein
MKDMQKIAIAWKDTMAEMRESCTPKKERNDEEESRGRCGDRQEHRKLKGREPGVAD